MYDGFPSPNVGGGNKIVYELIKGLLQSGKITETEYYSCDYNKLYKISDINNIEPQKLNAKKELGRLLYNKINTARNIFSSNYYLKYRFNRIDREFVKYTTKNTWDIIHSHMSISHYYFINSKSAKNVLSIHSKGSIRNDIKDILSLGRFHKTIIDELSKREVLAYNNSQVVVFPSNNARDLFLNDYGDKLNRGVKTEVIYNGIDFDMINLIKPEKYFLRKYIGKKEYDVILLNVANHIKDKNVNIILEIVKNLKERRLNPLLINVGEGPLSNALNALIVKENLKSNVLLLGKIPNTEIIKLMKTSNYLIMSSDRVIFDIVILEALACGLTVIATNNGGNKEVILNNQNGFLFDLNNIPHICNIILKGIKLKPDIENVRCYSSRTMCDMFYDLYNSI